MNKLLTLALLAHGATAFAPATKPIAVIGQQQRDGEFEAHESWTIKCE